MFLCFGSVDGKIKWEMVVREEIGLYGRGWCLVLMWLEPWEGNLVLMGSEADGGFGRDFWWFFHAIFLVCRREVRQKVRYRDSFF